MGEQKNITAAKLRESYKYDPDTGIFTRTGTSKRWPAGGTAGTLRKDGYLTLRVDGVLHLAHRLAWLYMTGEWPIADIDHIDGIRTNNHFANLRNVDRRTNLENLREAKSNNKTSGLLGVFAQSNTKKWRAAIEHEGKKIHLGYFKNKEDAHAAYLEAKRRVHAGCTI